jgi:hypothetical protein
MEFPGSHIVFRVLLGSASFICCWMAIGWFRQTREMKRTGKVRPLTLPLPAFLEIDIANEFAHRMTERYRDRRPPWLQAGLDRGQSCFDRLEQLPQDALSCASRPAGDLACDT